MFQQRCIALSSLWIVAGILGVWITNPAAAEEPNLDALLAIGATLTESEGVVTDLKIDWEPISESDKKTLLVRKLKL